MDIIKYKNKGIYKINMRFATRRELKHKIITLLQKHPEGLLKVQIYRFLGVKVDGNVTKSKPRKMIEELVKRNLIYARHLNAANGIILYYSIRNSKRMRRMERING